MGEETIEVATVSEGEAAGETVELPVVEVLTGRAFLTGKSGSGKSNTASVVAERLLDRGYGLMVVDIEGEYYGLKEEYEVLHAGADEECDVRVSEEHAGKLASLALEQNVPIVLDLSGFIDESEARDLLEAVARRLFAMEKKRKQPFLLVVEEIHEYVPEGGGMDDCGRTLVKLAKRGRKHGLGVAGISQRPADVKKDFITQCDWLVWHRLTWQNDTRVVKRVLGESYAESVEDLDDGEGFLMTDWGESVRRVQFHRKDTFDAGATPGLEDVERPDLKGVGEDLVAELSEISERAAAREDEIGQLKRELEERESRIEQLEAELAEARDLSEMAEQFARAMTAQAEPRFAPGEQRALDEYGGEPGEPGETGEPGEDGSGADAGVGPAGGRSGGSVPDPEPTTGAVSGGTSPAADDGETPDGGAGVVGDALTPEQAAIVEEAAAANRAGVGGVTIEPEPDDEGDTDGSGATDPAGPAAAPDRHESVAESLRTEIEALDPVARDMLAGYRGMGLAEPEAVHDAVEGSGGRRRAYAHNRTLRRAGFVVHVDRGRYAYSVPALLDARCEGSPDDRRETLLETVEAPLDA